MVTTQYPSASYNELFMTTLLQPTPVTRFETMTPRRLLGPRRQRTLARTVEMCGIGMVTGLPVRIRFVPAPADAGICFLRTDLPGASPIPAKADHVSGTARRTTLGTGPNQVTLVEHVLAALAGMRVDNCVVELNSSEPPGLDGSAEAFVETLVEAGTALQQQRKPCYAVTEPVSVTDGTATLSIYPREGEELLMSYLLDYGPASPIMPQSHTETITPARFRQEIARCRTYVLEQEAYDLQRQGVGKHLKLSELLVFGPKGLIDNRLRFPDEPARHKILDLVGDLALCGFDLVGHVVAYRSGHPLNVQLARTLMRLAQRDLRRVA